MVKSNKDLELYEKLYERYWKRWTDRTVPVSVTTQPSFFEVVIKPKGPDTDYNSVTLEEYINFSEVLRLNLSSHEIIELTLWYYEERS